jgi:hypothetical protein
LRDAAGGTDRRTIVCFLGRLFSHRASVDRRGLELGPA